MADNKRVPERLTKEEIREGYERIAPGLDDGGRICHGKTSKLVEEIDDQFSAGGLQQVENILIRPRFKRGDHSMATGIDAAVVFNLSGGSDIRYMGATDDGNFNVAIARQQALFKSAGISQSTGDYTTSDTFKKIMGSLALEFDDRNQIVIRKPSIDGGRNNNAKNLAIVLVDGMELLRMALRIKENDPYNFKVSNVERLNADEYYFTFWYFYDANYRRGKNRKNRNIDYQRLADSLFS